MSLKTDLEEQVKKILKDTWDVHNANVVPEDDARLTFSNTAAKLDATVLYADLAESTNLVDSKTAQFAAEIYKIYLHCAAKIIQDENGVITAYDGDRIMAVYVGGSKNTEAVTTALKINYVVSTIINPAIINQYGAGKYTLKQKVGVDSSELLITKTGVRKYNDYVWVGRAANYAAKLAARSEGFSTYITKDVYDNMSNSVKSTAQGISLWESRIWSDYNSTYYRSDGWYTF